MSTSSLSLSLSGSCLHPRCFVGRKASTQLRGQLRRQCIAEGLIPGVARTFQSSRTLLDDDKTVAAKKEQDDEKGALSRRLEDMAEQAVLEGGNRAVKDLQDAGFSGDLKQRLEERIKATEGQAYRLENQRAFSVAEMPSSAGKGTQDIAASAPWTGKESLHDVSLRMLDDASKPMKVPFKVPNPVNMAPEPKPRLSPAQRIASAKDKTASYKDVKQEGLSSKEREEYLKELRERFTPVARPMPISPQGLTSLANERIDDAIAQGQFNNIKRGKGVGTQRDHVADSPFVDTTEYLMNRIVKNQDVTPPWIEKQQGMAVEVQKFREGLRSDWRRHALYLICKLSGTAEGQMRYAKAYAAAEGSSQASGSNEALPNVPPLRDPAFTEKHENHYALAIRTINDHMRGYNLMAPAVTQKPYLKLEREWATCYAAVNPTLPDELRKRQKEQAEKMTERSASSSGASSGGGRSIWSFFGL